MLCSLDETMESILMGIPFSGTPLASQMLKQLKYVGAWGIFTLTLLGASFWKENKHDGDPDHLICISSWCKGDGIHSVWGIESCVAATVIISTRSHNYLYFHSRFLIDLFSLLFINTPK